MSFIERIFGKKQDGDFKHIPDALRLDSDVRPVDKANTVEKNNKSWQPSNTFSERGAKATSGDQQVKGLRGQL
jgi:hypothetical protein